MASGSFTKKVGNRSYAENEYIKVWWESTPDPANNRSKVHVWAKMYRPWYLAVDYDQAIEFWINGEKYTTSRYGWRGSGWTKAYLDKTVYVPHNSEGKKTVKIRVRTQVKAWLDDYVGWVDTGYQSCKLDNLARKSTFTLDKTSATIGDTIKVTLSRSSSKVRHNITFNVGDYKTNILTKSTDDGKATSYTYTIPTDEVLSYMAGQSATAKVIVTTYNGSTKIGSNNKTFTLKIRSNIDRPSIPSDTGLVIEAIPIEPNTSTLHYIQGKTKVKVSINPNLSAGSAGAINTYNVTVNSGNATVEKKYSSNTNIITTDVLDVSGTCNISAQVIDARGMSSEVATTTIDVLEYFAPLISNFSISRCLEDGTPDVNGSYAKVSFGYKFAECGGNNSVTITLSERNVVNSEEYNDIQIWVMSTSATGTIEEILESTYSLDSSFDFELAITDLYGASSTVYADIGTEEILIDLYENAVGIGKVVERENALEVGWETWFEEPVHATVQTYTSDIRKKLLVGDSLLPLLKIWDELSIVLFKYRDADDKKLLGLVAQDVISIFNAHELDWRDYGLVYEDPATGYYSINYEFINQLSMLKVKTLQSQICELASRITKLEK